MSREINSLGPASEGPLDSDRGDGCATVVLVAASFGILVFVLLGALGLLS